MREFQPGEIAIMTTDDIRASHLSDWRHRGLMDGIGRASTYGHWKYRWHELLKLVLARILEKDGIEIGPAISMASLAQAGVFNSLATQDTVFRERVSESWLANLYEEAKSRRFVIAVPSSTARHGVEVRWAISPDNLFGVRFYQVIDTWELAKEIPQPLWHVVRDAFLAAPEE